MGGRRGVRGRESRINKEGEIERVGETEGARERREGEKEGEGERDHVINARYRWADRQTDRETGRHLENSNNHPVWNTTDKRLNFTELTS